MANRCTVIGSSVSDMIFKRFALVIFIGIALFSLNGCGTFTGDIDGEIDINLSPEVEFANIPADGDTFSFAPVVYWKGRDADGFVEKFMYADIVDPTAIANPLYFIDFIPEDAWVETEATSDTVFLLTESGEITKHIFYLKCIDDLGEESEVIYRTFNRSNHAPNVPEIKWWASADEEFANEIFLEDTLYTLDKITESWTGLGFAWKSSDPDDRDLFTIPLEYKYYLEKVPHDTIWEWVSLDWSRKQELQFYGLETGHYTFSVWVRDDGFEQSVRPATATFDVYEPTFGEDILLLNTTLEDSNGREGFGDVVPGTQIGEFYQELLAKYPSSTYINFPADGVDARYKSFLGRFKLIIWCDENRSYLNYLLEDALTDYIDIGGRLWMTGTYLQNKALVIRDVLNQLNTSFSQPQAQYRSGPAVDFMGSNTAVDDLPDLSVDSTRTVDAYQRFYGSNWMPYPFLPGVDILAGQTGAETVYYYRSFTDTLSGDVINDTAVVRLYADTIYFPPTPQACIVRLPRNRIFSVSRVHNASRGVAGEVVNVTNNAMRLGNDVYAIAKISYPWGEPWSVEDTIVVDYKYQPYSEFHLRPVGVRFERLSSQLEGSGRRVRYRIALFTFPLYFMDNSNGEVTDMFDSMLRWFFQPEAHS